MFKKAQKNYEPSLLAFDAVFLARLVGELAGRAGFALRRSGDVLVVRGLALGAILAARLARVGADGAVVTAGGFRRFVVPG